MALRAFRNLVQFEHADQCMTNTQMIATTEFVSRQCPFRHSIIIGPELQKKMTKSTKWCAKTFEPGHEKMCLKSYADNKAADQPAHPRSLISAFVVRCLDSIIYLDSIAEISRL